MFVKKCNIGEHYVMQFLVFMGHNSVMKNEWIGDCRECFLHFGCEMNCRRSVFFFKKSDLRIDKCVRAIIETLMHLLM